jgi:hypothetical protein
MLSAAIRSVCRESSMNQGGKMHRAASGQLFSIMDLGAQWTPASCRRFSGVFLPVRPIESILPHESI